MRQYVCRSWVALIALTTLTVHVAAAQTSNAWHPIFVITTGATLPVGQLASVTSAAPNIYVGLAFHPGASRTTYEIGESFTAVSAREQEHGAIAVAAATVTHFIPLRPGLETYIALGVGQSYVSGTAMEQGFMANVSRLGLALMSGTGLRIGGRVGVLLAVNYAALIHDGATLQMVPVSVGVNLR